MVTASLVFSVATSRCVDSCSKHPGILVADKCLAAIPRAYVPNGKNTAICAATERLKIGGETLGLKGGLWSKEDSYLRSSSCVSMTQGVHLRA